MSWLRDRKLGSFIGALHNWANCGHDPQGGPVHPIADLQIEYSLISRGIADSILSACARLAPRRR
jgi:hypothetical protein